MNGQQATQCLTLMQSAWRGRWTEQQEDYWLFELLSFDAEVAAEAIRRLAREVDHTPSLHQLVESVHVINGERRRKDDERRLALGRGDEREGATAEVGLKAMRAMRQRIGNLATHDHHRGAANCPLCKRHDHGDVTPFGFTKTVVRGEAANREGVVETFEHSMPVEAWRFTCPACGDPAVAQLSCDTWTPEGVAYMRAHRGQRVAEHAEVF